MIITLNEAIQFSSESRQNGQCVGYLSGCFDILHIGHIEFLREAKRHVDILIVGLDNDSTIQLSKHKDKPCNSLPVRLEQLSELRSVDYVFPMHEIFTYKTQHADEVHKHLLDLISPNFYIINVIKDAYWKRKARFSTELGIDILKIRKEKSISTTEIFRRLMSHP